MDIETRGRRQRRTRHTVEVPVTIILLPVAPRQLQAEVKNGVWTADAARGALRPKRSRGRCSARLSCSWKTTLVVIVVEVVVRVLRMVNIGVIAVAVVK